MVLVIYSWQTGWLQIKSLDLSGEVGNCLLSLGLSCFPKWVMLPQRSKKEENCRQKWLKSLFEKREIFFTFSVHEAAGCVSPITQCLGHINKDAAEVAFTQHSASEVAWW